MDKRVARGSHAYEDGSGVAIRQNRSRAVEHTPTWYHIIFIRVAGNYQFTCGWQLQAEGNAAYCSICGITSCSLGRSRLLVEAGSLGTGTLER